MFLAQTTFCEAQALGRLAQVSIVDRDSGAILTPRYYRGEYWVAGRPGARYSVEIRNRMGERLLAVTSVDGVNVVSGATAAWDQAGYVFGPGERYQITGWRKSDTDVAAFTFTAAPNSYAERTGRPANVGVIGVAIFRERQPEMTYTPESRREAGAADSATAKAVPNAPLAQAEGLARSSPSLKLGTGHGEREYSYVSRTEFARMQTEPNEVVRIHYDSLDNLIAMGIVRQPKPAWPTLNPFPGSPDAQYVPDPPG
jgi:hypothetical protein